MELIAIFVVFFAAVVAVVFPLLWLLDKADREHREIEEARAVAEAAGVPLSFRLGVQVDGEDLEVGAATPAIRALPLPVARALRRKGARL